MSQSRHESIPLWRLRLRAAAPRLLACVACLFLSLAGLRALVAPAAPVAAAAPKTTAFDPGAAAFAEGFARAYLAFDPERPELREAALAAYLPEGLDADAGHAPATRTEVRWAAVVSDERRGAGRVVTVEADTSGGILHVAVPVARDRDGFLSLSAPPALVGAPAIRRDRAPREGPGVEDGELRRLVGRVVRNYLAGERSDLAPDLDPRAVVSLPALRLTVRSVESVSWLERGRSVAVSVEADDRRGGSGGWCFGCGHGGGAAELASLLRTDGRDEAGVKSEHAQSR